MGGVYSSWFDFTLVVSCTICLEWWNDSLNAVALITAHYHARLVLVIVDEIVEYTLHFIFIYSIPQAEVKTG